MFTLLNMRVIIVNVLYLSLISRPLVEKHWPKARVIYYPSSSDNVKKKKTFVPHLFGSIVFADFYFKHCLTPNCCWYESQSKTCTVLTGYLKPKEERENSNDPPPWWYRYNRCDIRSINRWENFLTVTTLVYDRISNLRLYYVDSGTQHHNKMIF